MTHGQPSTVEMDAPASNDAWLRLLRLNTTESEPARPSKARRFAIGMLLGFIFAMAIVVRSELLRTPDGALAGLLLRSEIKIAELMPAASSSVVIEVEQRPLRMMTHGAAASAPRRRSHHLIRSTHRASGQQPVDNLQTAGPGHFQLLPIRPLRPFNVEVVNGAHRRLLPGRPAGVQVDITDSQSLLGPETTVGASPGGNRPATLRALISPEGRVEDLWLVQGPRPTPAALNMIRQARYRPWMINGTPVEMEAFIVMDGAPSGPPPGSASSNRE